ncbi:MAG: MBL fold metallo-hydrolase [Pseudomonadota bacterium]
MRVEARPGFPERGDVAIAWLGQAGFWIETGQHSVLIDPYLSDSLARKYAGKVHDHRRMMPVPIAPDALRRPYLVLITHAHTDHMDPDTLAPLVERFPDLPFVVPRAKMEVARERIGQEAQLIDVTAGDVIEPLAGLSITVMPAAHEAEERDLEGNHVFLGYGMAFDLPDSEVVRLYHSGDTIPFDALDDALSSFKPDIALLPVNGRDTERLAAGIPGNMTLEEAVLLCGKAGIPWMIPHHFGMFAFNTVDEQVIDVAVETIMSPRLVKPKIGEALHLVG